MKNDDEKLVGLAKAERILREKYPRFAMSRHALRRGCMNGTFPATPLPCGGQRVRYKVCVYDVVCLLRAFGREGTAAFRTPRRAGAMVQG